ncbi:Xylose isomerase domain-containing protein TIM barrel OS=Planctomyces brasiliensis (strain ATCC 49424 / DSM 5305 / JCM 21570 / NBRC 103401 / IFAM 1448) GN=Plabr_0077 PE=4 SV=1: AP_endonuc_2 [Gemmata massiliana]|uniref:Xylose isomerase-like TIM barrel domain-containing protein n=1 Tax=Gemmata massiliana TaxID=1210884 RepID=A0A6P2DAJ3_9BACT|nr:sugar phosphate isomerase/epimerase [Gemmata massiliana]VTR97375.1 Xylose isomerase domain-containing protein TIM barrel OS=Planctomyces brasiliensis (strain ATCC 49424 / DSM 5305 / JCM 21570 / NBRC 103401 / IFAM 1448) GN=Plabr_0077 PE=4 SV=1: AP_endonuc_2 [Gemmata massiliana]
MKLGMNLLLWTGQVTAEHFPLLAKLKAAGFDGVELPVFGGAPSDYKPVRAELDRLGLKCTTVTILTKETNAASPDAATRQKAVEWLKTVVEINHVLGAETVCGPYHSAIGEFTGTGPTADEKKHSADVLRQVAEFAKQANLMMAVEYLNRFECYLINTAAQAVELVKMVDHPNLRTMYDSFHAHIEEKDPAAAIRTIAPVLAHVHISENDRGIPGTGQVNWDDTFGALADIKYDGWMTIESFGRALPDIAAATKVWRDLFPTAEDVYTKGIKFIKEQLSGSSTCCG